MFVGHQCPTYGLSDDLSGSLKLKPHLRPQLPLINHHSRRDPLGDTPLIVPTLPVGNIAAANGAGVSINEYSELSIDPAGLILNNGYTISRTELAGWIDRNPNLAYGPAQIIVNQVTGAGITNMNGFLEVAGGRADVVIANENGIRVSGGGFINTDRAVLTTGRPEFGRDGSLDRIRVTEGAVSFEGKGIDARGASSLEVLTRAEQINADIFANGWNSNPHSEWGAGPYTIDSVNDMQVSFVPNPTWWGERAKLDSITYKQMDAQALFNAFKNGEIDATGSSAFTSPEASMVMDCPSPRPVKMTRQASDLAFSLM